MNIAVTRFFITLSVLNHHLVFLGNEFMAAFVLLALSIPSYPEVLEGQRRANAKLHVNQHTSRPSEYNKQGRMLYLLAEIG